VQSGGAATQAPVGAAPSKPVVVPASYVTAAEPAAAPAADRAKPAALAVRPGAAAAAAPAVVAASIAQVQAAGVQLYPVDVHTGSAGQVMHLQTGYLQVPAAQAREPARAAAAQGAVPAAAPRL
jgi:hypothetical protein